TRREQHPDWKDRRGQSVNHDRPRDPSRVVSKPCFNRWKIREKLSAPNTNTKTDQSDDRYDRDIEFSAAQTETHDQRGWNCHRDREHAPRTFRERLHDNEREYGEQNDHDCHHADESERTHAATDLVPHHLPYRFSTAADLSRAPDQ